MHRVSQIINRKKRETISVRPDSKVLEALHLMAEHNIGALVVKDNHGKYCGILTERDYSRKVVLMGKSSTDTLVEEIMSTNMKAVTPSDTVDDCMQLMTRDNVRYLPVFKDHDLIGIVSMSDVVKETILIQQETIKHLETYITRQ